MGKAILERLLERTPNGRKLHVKNESLGVMYKLVREHSAEIEEAFARGYSWRQIDEACRECWQENGHEASGITWWKNGDLVRVCYHAVKHGTTVGKKYRG